MTIVRLISSLKNETPLEFQQRMEALGHKVDFALTKKEYYQKRRKLCATTPVHSSPLTP